MLTSCAGGVLDGLRSLDCLFRLRSSDVGALLQRTLAVSCLPAVIVCFVLPLQLLRRLCTTAKFSLADELVASALVAVTLLQYSVARDLIDVFSCFEAGPETFVLGNTWLGCGKAEHARAMAVASVGLLLYAVAFPLVIWTAVRRG